MAAIGPAAHLGVARSKLQFRNDGLQSAAQSRSRGDRGRCDSMRCCELGGLLVHRLLRPVRRDDGDVGTINGDNYDGKPFLGDVPDGYPVLEQCVRRLHRDQSLECCIYLMSTYTSALLC